MRLAESQNFLTNYGKEGRWRNFSSVDDSQYTVYSVTDDEGIPRTTQWVNHLRW